MSEVLRQQINLFQPIFRPQKQVFSALTMFQSIGVIAVALVTIYLFGLYQVGKLQAQAVELEGMERTKSVQLASLDTASGPARRAEIERELEALNATLAARQKLIDVLEARPPGSTSGFSRYLQGLARQRHAGVWLTAITISGVHEAIELHGRSLDARLVPEYLAVLTADKALTGQRFDDFSIERSADGDLQFHVSSTAAQASADPSQEERR